MLPTSGVLGRVLTIGGKKTELSWSMAKCKLRWKLGFHMSFQKVRDSLIYCTMHINQRVLSIRTGNMKIFVSIHWVQKLRPLPSILGVTLTHHLDAQREKIWKCARKNKQVCVHTSHSEENPRSSPPDARAPKLWIKSISSRPFLSCSGRPALITATYMSSSWWAIPAKWARPLSS